MINKLTTMCVAVGISTALVFAQGPKRGNPNGTPPDPQTIIQNRVNRLATLLSLTDDQKTQATTIFMNAYTASQGIHTSMQSNRQSLDTAIKQNDTAAIDQLSAAAGTLSGQLLDINSKADAAFYAILTPDQQAKYDSLHQGGPGGFGGPMGPRNFGPGRRAPGQ